MGVRLPTNNELLALVATELPGDHAVVPAPGVLDWYFLHLQRLWMMSRASAGSLRVERSASANTSIEVFAGRASFGGTSLAYAGGTVALAAYGDDVVYVWAYNNAGTLTISSAADATGWPATEHVKLAEVTIAGGDIGYDAIVDRRPESMLTAGIRAAGASLRGGVLIAAADPDIGALTAVDPNAITSADPNAITSADPNAITSADPDALTATAIAAADAPATGSGADGTTPSGAEFTAATTLANELKVDYTALLADVTSVRTQLVADRADLASVRTQLIADRADLASVRTQLVADRADLASVRTQLVAAIADIATIRGDINDLKAKLRTSGVIAA